MTMELCPHRLPLYDYCHACMTEALAFSRPAEEKKPRESTVEKHLVKRVKELGGEVRKVRWLDRNGAPDRLVMLPETWWKDFVHGQLRDKRHPPRTFYAELKAPGEVPEPHQLREHERLRSFGLRVEVIDSIEKVDEVLGL